jgi:hypothetical protein
VENPERKATMNVVHMRPHHRAPVKRKRELPDTWGPKIEIKSAASWRFQWHREILKRWDLTRRPEIAVAGVLMHAFQIKGWFSELSFGQLAERAGCSRREAQRAVIKLRENGLIKVGNQGARDRTGRQQTNRYVLIYRCRGIP